MLREWMLVSEVRDLLRKQNQLLERLILTLGASKGGFVGYETDEGEDESVLIETNEEQRVLNAIKEELRKTGYRVPTHQRGQ